MAINCVAINCVAINCVIALGTLEQNASAQLQQFKKKGAKINKIRNAGAKY